MDRSAEKYSFITEWSLSFLDTVARSFHPSLSNFFRKNISDAAKSALQKNVILSVERYNTYCVLILWFMYLIILVAV